MMTGQEMSLVMKEMRETVFGIRHFGFVSTVQEQKSCRVVQAKLPTQPAHLQIDETIPEEFDEQHHDADRSRPFVALGTAIRTK